MELPTTNPESEPPPAASSGIRRLLSQACSTREEKRNHATSVDMTNFLDME